MTTPSTGTGKLAGGSAKVNCKATIGCLIDEPTQAERQTPKTRLCSLQSSSQLLAAVSIHGHHAGACDPVPLHQQRMSDRTKMQTASVICLVGSAHCDLPRFGMLHFRHVSFQDVVAISRLDSILLNCLRQIERS